MSEGITYVGLDVHLRSISVAAIRAGGEVLHTSTIQHADRSLERTLRQLQRDGSVLSVAYEAGPTGYGIYRQLTRLGIPCLVAAPSLVPTRPGNRVKNDRRDAHHLAAMLSTGHLTGVLVPTPELEAIRDLSRAREHAKRERHQHRQRLIKFLHFHGITEPGKPARWSKRYFIWLDALCFDQPQLTIVFDDLLATVISATQREARLRVALDATMQSSSFALLYRTLQSIYSIGPIIAAGLIAEFGDMRRFPSARAMMAAAGLTPTEHSSGERIHRGGITKTGNSHVRFLLGEAAPHFCRPCPPDGDRVRLRLCARYAALRRRSKPKPVALTAVARELIGFIWEVAVKDDLLPAA